MPPSAKNLTDQYQISKLCTVMDATLQPCWEEGIARHNVHELLVPIVVGPKGILEPTTDRQIGVVMGLTRLTELPAHMEEDLRRLPYRPYESLYLALPVADPVLRHRTRLLNEASGLFLDLAEAESLVKVAAISHRRRIGSSIVVRHYPVALFDQASGCLWAHPAGNAYGLIRPGFPKTQRVRSLGPRRPEGKTPETLTRLDDESGLPQWYRFAKEQLKDLQDGEDPIYRAIMDFQAQCWLQRSLVEDAEHALRETTQQFLHGFETFFGMGGLQPVPGRLDLA